MTADNIHNGREHATQNIRFAFFLNLFFTLIEIYGGLWTNSLAILSDALHDLGDSFALGSSWLLEKYAGRREDAHFSYGYQRFSLLGALLNALVLTGGSVYILLEAVPRLLQPEPTRAGGMALLALLGILTNGWAVLRVRRSRSMNAQIIAWHLLEDVLGWASVLIVGVVLLFREIYVLDPLLSVFITLYVMGNALRHLKKTADIFLQGVPAYIDPQEIQEKIMDIPKVCSTHHLHLWSLDGERNVFTVHVVVEKGSSAEDLQRVRREVNQMAGVYDFAHTAVEVECEDQECRMKDSPVDPAPGG